MYQLLIIMSAIICTSIYNDLRGKQNDAVNDSTINNKFSYRLLFVVQHIL